MEVQFHIIKITSKLRNIIQKFLKKTLQMPYNRGIEELSANSSLEFTIGSKFDSH